MNEERFRDKDYIEDVNRFGLLVYTDLIKNHSRLSKLCPNVCQALSCTLVAFDKDRKRVLEAAKESLTKFIPPDEKELREDVLENTMAAIKSSLVMSLLHRLEVNLLELFCSAGPKVSAKDLTEERLDKAYKDVWVIRAKHTLELFYGMLSQLCPLDEQVMYYCVALGEGFLDRVQYYAKHQGVSIPAIPSRYPAALFKALAEAYNIQDIAPSEQRVGLFQNFLSIIRGSEREEWVDGSLPSEEGGQPEDEGGR